MLVLYIILKKGNYHVEESKSAMLMITHTLWELMWQWEMPFLIIYNDLIGTARTWRRDLFALVILPKITHQENISVI